MKKFLLAVAVLLSSVTLTGCGKDTKKTEEPKKEEPKKEEKVESKFDINKYTKEVEKYELQDTGKKHKLELGYAKDAGYKKGQVVSNYMLKLENEKDTSKVQVEFFHTNLEKSLSVSKKTEKDFDANRIKNYKKLNINGKEGWEVFRVNSTTQKIMSYEAQLFLSDADEKGYTSAVKVTVNVNSTTDEGKAFDFEKYVQSDDFQYLLHSITLAS
jgi:hypothetical protein